MGSSGVWILAEQRHGRVQQVSHELLTRGRDLADKRGCSLSAMLFGHQIAAADLEELIKRGADRVVTMQAAELEHFRCRPYAACVLDILQRYRPEIILAGATTTGRTLMAQRRSVMTRQAAMGCASSATAIIT